MAIFHFPEINPYQVPQRIGTDGIHSKYLFNNYRTEWTPSLWRTAIDRAIQYSDLSYLDALYSWCMQASPFLQSQINKRLLPIYKRNFVFGRAGKENRSMTDKYIRNSWWFKRFIRYVILSQFYGVKAFAINPDDHEVVDFPLRNIDIFNKGLRYQTFEYFSIINAKDYDNMFFIQPETDQDFKLGMLQAISRAMIGIVETFNNWQVLGKRYSFPMTTIGYLANNSQAESAARGVAEQYDMLTTPIIPYVYSNGDRDHKNYAIEINPIPTQTVADAFRVFKEYIIEYRSEIMQLVTGGTLLGATEKNTNSEQLAEIHWDIYQDILDSDAEYGLSVINSEAVKHKLAVTFDDPMIEKTPIIEIPDERVSVTKFVDIGEMLAKQKGYFSPEAFKRVGLDPKDVVQPAEEQRKTSLFDRILGRKAPAEAPAEETTEELGQDQEQ